MKAIEVSKLSTNSKIKLIWIPAHIGISGNEQADQIAKTATTKSFSTNSHIPFTDLCKKFKSDSSKETEQTIRKYSETKGTEYFTLYYKNNSKPWFDNCNLNRANIVMINRIRANHYNLAASLARVNFVNDASCQLNKILNTYFGTVLCTPKNKTDQWPKNVRNIFAIYCQNAPYRHKPIYL